MPLPGPVCDSIPAGPRQSGRDRRTGRPCPRRAHSRAVTARWCCSGRFARFRIRPLRGQVGRCHGDGNAGRPLHRRRMWLVFWVSTLRRPRGFSGSPVGGTVSPLPATATRRVFWVTLGWLGAAVIAVSARSSSRSFTYASHSPAVQAEAPESQVFGGRGEVVDVHAWDRRSGGHRSSLREGLGASGATDPAVAAASRRATPTCANSIDFFVL